MNKSILFAMLLATSIFAIPWHLAAQDTIVLKSNLVITGTISEIRSDSVFLLRNSTAKPFGFALSDISSMKLSNKQSSNKTEKLNDLPHPYGISAQRDSIPNYRHIIKTTTFAPAFGHFGVGFEKELKNGFKHTSLETMLGVIFLDGNYAELVSFESDVYGGYLRAGIRWYFPPTTKTASSHQRLMGSYIGFMNTLAFFQFREEYSESIYYGYYYYYTIEHSRYYHIAKYNIECVFGTQLPLSNRLVFNFYGGLGLNFTKIFSSDGQHPYMPVNQFTNMNFGIFSLSAGALLGYRF